MFIFPGSLNSNSELNKHDWVEHGASSAAEGEQTNKQTSLVLFKFSEHVHENLGENIILIHIVDHEIAFLKIPSDVKATRTSIKVRQIVCP